MKRSTSATTPAAPVRISRDAAERADRVRRNLDWLAKVSGVVARLSDGSESRYRPRNAKYLVDAYLTVIEGARSVIRGTSGESLTPVVIVETMLRYFVTAEPWTPSPLTAAVLIDLDNAMPSDAWWKPHRRRQGPAMATVAAEWDPLGLGTVPPAAWTKLLADYRAAPAPRRLRGVRKRGARDRDDVLWEFLSAHGITRSKSTKNLRDAVARRGRTQPR